MSAPSPNRTRAEIDLDALRANARFCQSLTGTTAPALVAVVKANAYGLGAAAIARALEDEVAAFAVASVAEARELAAAGIRRQLLVLSPILPGEEREAVALGCCVAISTADEADRMAAEACAQRRRAPVHVVVDTGMGRMGVLPREAAALIRRVQEISWLELQSVASHFASSDEDEEFTTQQESAFRAVLAESGASGCTHIANSAGALRGHCRPGEWIRCGLMLYGVSPVPEFQSRLQPVLTWKSHVTLVRTLPAGWGISYGRTHLLAAPARVASLAAGYGDGYPRQVSGHGGHVLIRGQRCPILGRVTMDQIMADVSALPADVRPGEEVVLLGQQGGEFISAGEIAAQAGTIPWHVFTGITERTARLYLAGDAGV